MIRYNAAPFLRREKSARFCPAALEAGHAERAVSERAVGGHYTLSMPSSCWPYSLGSMIPHAALSPARKVSTLMRPGTAAPTFTPLSRFAPVRGLLIWAAAA